MRTEISIGLLVLSLVTAVATADTSESPQAITTPPSTAAADADPRPSPRERHPLASPVTAGSVMDGQTEGEAYLAALEPEVRDELLEEGHVLKNEEEERDGSYGGFIRAVAIFHNSKERAWELMTEPSMQPEFLPRLQGAEAVEATEYGELVRFHLRVAFRNIHFHVRHWYYPEISRIKWYLDHEFENDIDDQEGYWQLFAISEELTVGEYGTRVDTGIAVPRRIQDFFARRDIPDAMESFRAYIDSDGEYRR